MDNWRDDLGSCADHAEPDLWATSDRNMTRAKAEAIAEAKAVCRGCPVLQACGAAALADPSLTGVWGGLTDAERARLRPRAKRTRAAYQTRRTA